MLKLNFLNTTHFHSDIPLRHHLYQRNSNVCLFCLTFTDVSVLSFKYIFLINKKTGRYYGVNIKHKALCPGEG